MKHKHRIKISIAGCIVAIEIFSFSPAYSKPKEKTIKDTSTTTPTKSKTTLTQIDKTWMKEIKKEKTDESKGSKTPTNSQTTQKTNDKNTPTKQINTEQNTNRGIFADPEETPSFFSVLVRFLGLMTLFIGGFFLAIQYLKKRGKGSFLHQNNGLVDVILSVPLVQGKFLQIVDIAGQLMILGVSESGIQMLSQIEDGKTADKIRLWQSKDTGPVNPAGLLESLTHMIKEGDFKFWDNDKKRESFESVLNNEIPSRTQKNQNISNKNPEQDGMDEIGDMLKKHEKKLKSLKKK